MNSLMNYGSDDDCDESPDEKLRDSQCGPSRNYRKSSQGQDDVNYDDVGMDMSEDSDKEQSMRKEESRREEKRARDSEHKKEERRKEEKYSSSQDKRSKDKEERRDRYRDDRDDKRDKDDDRRDRRRDERSGRDDRHGRDRKDRDRRRSRSRDKDRRRSRSPRRSRSKSKERSGPRSYANRRFEKTSQKMDRLDKMGIDIKPTETARAMNEEKAEQQTSSNNRFFMPGITGRFRDQIERRKMLWQKGKEQPQIQPNIQTGKPSTVGVNQSAKVWQNTSFGDDKTSNKFKRLMGIRDAGEAPSASKPATEVLKKQEQMFNSMEAQYEVARAATHTMRGVGLGFGSFQR